MNICNYRNTDVGDKVIFDGTRPTFFANQIRDADRLLLVGQTYTVDQISVASSSTGVKLVEFPGISFSLSFFKPTVEKTTNKNDPKPFLFPKKPIAGM